MIVAFSGCATPLAAHGAPPGTHVGNLPEDAGEVQSQQQSPNATEGKHALRALPVKAMYFDYQTTAAGVGCAQPPFGCLHMSGSVNFTGGMRGQAAYIVHDLPPDPATPQRFLHYIKNPFTFTGSIDGCGSGSLGFTVVGFFALDNQGLQVNETLQYVPGSATTGFAGLAAAVLTIDTHDYPNPVPITGTVWCS